MNGNAICQAVKIVGKTGAQVDLILDKCTEQMCRLLDAGEISAFHKNKKLAFDEFSEEFEDAGWVTTVSLAEVYLVPKKKKKTTACISFEVVLFDSEDSNIENWQPAVYIMYVAQSEGLNIAEIRLRKKENNPLKLTSHKILRWDQCGRGEHDSWIFIVPLVKINNEDAIKKQIIAPIKNLLNNNNAEDKNIFPEDSIAFDFKLNSDNELEISA